MNRLFRAVALLAVLPAAPCLSESVPPPKDEQAAAKTVGGAPWLHLVDNPEAAVSLKRLDDKVLTDFQDRAIPVEFMDRVVFNKQPKKPSGPAEMQVDYYEGSWSKLPNFTLLNPKKSDTSTSLSTSIRDREANYAIRWTGALKITKQGKYKFYVKSSDGSKLIVNNKDVVNNDGIHAQIERYGYIDLEPGVVPFELRFFDKDGGTYFSAYVRVPGGSKSSLTSILAPVPKEDKSSQVLLKNGDLLRGGIVRWEEGTLHLDSAIAAKTNTLFRIPESMIREVWTTGFGKKQVAGIRPDDAEEGDTVWIRKNEDIRAVKGLCLGVSTNQTLRFKFGGEERKVSLDRVVGLSLDARPPPPLPTGPYHVLVLRDGDRISGAWAALGETGIVFDPVHGKRIEINAEEVQRIETRNGRIQHLSDIEPSDVIQVPYFDRLMPMRRNQSLTGTSLRMDGKTYSRGLAVHARCTVHYQLNGDYDEFRCLAGFQEGTGNLGRAIIRVMGDGEVLFEKPDARGDEKPFPIKVPIKNVKKLTLEVDFGDHEDVGDRVVWADPQVVRTEGLEKIPPLKPEEEKKDEKAPAAEATETPAKPAAGTTGEGNGAATARKAVVDRPAAVNIAPAAPKQKGAAPAAKLIDGVLAELDAKDGGKPKPARPAPPAKQAGRNVIDAALDEFENSR